MRRLPDTISLALQKNAMYSSEHLHRSHLPVMPSKEGYPKMRRLLLNVFMLVIYL